MEGKGVGMGPRRGVCGENTKIHRREGRYLGVDEPRYARLRSAVGVDRLRLRVYGAFRVQPVGGAPRSREGDTLRCTRVRPSFLGSPLSSQSMPQCNTTLLRTHVC